jgi:hypothetical protein
MSHLEIFIWGGVVSLDVRLDKSFWAKHGWYAWRGMLFQRQTLNTLQMRCHKPSGWSDPLEWTKGCLSDSGDWKVWQVPGNLAKDALRMVSLEDLENASMCWRSKRTIAPNQWQREWLLGLLPLMCSNHQWTAPSIDNEASAAHLLEEDDCHCQRKKATNGGK